VQARCHALAVELRNQIAELTGCQQIAPESWFAQMFTAPLPPCDPEVVKAHLWDDCRIEVPVFTWGERQYVRVSLQGYNTREDGQKLLTALREIFH
jgi:isopenicillin-N epimerase